MADKKITIHIRAKDTATRAIRRVTRETKHLKRAVLGALGAFTLLTAATGVFFRSLVKVGSQAEQARIRLDSIFGSVDKGAEAFEAVRLVAAQLPQTFEEILSAATAMSVAVSRGGGDLETRLRQVAEISARFGLPIEQAARSFQRFALGGAASAVQFRRAGVNAFLGIKAGATTSAKESLRIWDEAFAEIERSGTSATDRLADSWVGNLSMLEDHWFLFKLRIARSGVFEAVSGAVRALRVEIDQLSDSGAIDRWAQQIGEAVRTAMRGIGSVFVVLGNSIDAMVRNPLLAEFGLIGYAFMGAKGAALFAFLGDRINALAELMAGPQTELELRQKRLAELGADIQRATEAVRGGRGGLPARQFGFDVEGSIEDALPALRKQFEFQVGVLGKNFDVIWGDFEEHQTTVVGNVFRTIGEALKEGSESVTGLAMDTVTAGGGVASSTDVPLLPGSLGTGFGPLLADQLKGAFDIALDPAEVTEHARLLDVHLEKVMDEAWANLDQSLKMEKYFKDMGKTVAELAVSVGEQMINGIISGTLDAKDILKRFLIGFVSLYIMGPLKIALGILSPSKVTYGIGQNLALGMIGGMDSMGGALTAASGRMAATVTSGLSVPQLGGLSGVARQPGTLTAKIQTDDTASHPPWALDWLARGNIELTYAGER